MHSTSGEVERDKSRSSHRYFLRLMVIVPNFLCFFRSQSSAWECIFILMIDMQMVMDVCIPNEDIGNEKYFQLRTHRVRNSIRG